MTPEQINKLRKGNVVAGNKGQLFRISGVKKEDDGQRTYEVVSVRIWTLSASQT